MAGEPLARIYAAREPIDCRCNSDITPHISGSDPPIGCMISLECGDLWPSTERSKGRWRLPSKPDARESRRSTRVSLRVTIDACGISEPLSCEGETIMVNLHGALISTPVVLKVGTIIEIEVYLTGKRARAMIVYVDPNKPLHCGIALAKPENIWGVSLPPDDWREGDSESAPEPR